MLHWVLYLEVCTDYFEFQIDPLERQPSIYFALYLMGEHEITGLLECPVRGMDFRRLVRPGT